MEQRLNVIALGVRDVPTSLAFFQALGWLEHPKSTSKMPMFDTGGIILALYDRAALAEYAGVSGFADGFPSVTLTHNVRTRGEVDRILNKVERLGGKITRSAAEMPSGGYFGFFTDPDGHLWEVVWNPRWPLDDKGSLT